MFHFHVQQITQRIHGTGIFTYIYYKHHPFMDQYICRHPMDLWWVSSYLPQLAIRRPRIRWDHQAMSLVTTAHRRRMFFSMVVQDVDLAQIILVICWIMPPSYVGIITRHCKDPYENPMNQSVSWVLSVGFEHCSLRFFKQTHSKKNKAPKIWKSESPRQASNQKPTFWGPFSSQAFSYPEKESENPGIVVDTFLME